jgi:GNAT superfamily N-acetyltransferase
MYLNPLLDTYKAYFHGFVAQDMSSNEIIGYILYFNTLDDCKGQLVEPLVVIEDLFVKHCYRGRGIGTQLLLTVLKVSTSA